MTMTDSTLSGYCPACGEPELEFGTCLYCKAEVRECPKCSGVGTNWNGSACSKCGGDGRIATAYGAAQ